MSNQLDQMAASGGIVILSVSNNHFVIYIEVLQWSVQPPFIEL